jgi:hypothetical protein
MNGRLRYGERNAAVRKTVPSGKIAGRAEASNGSALYITRLVTCAQPMNFNFSALIHTRNANSWRRTCRSVLVTYTKRRMRT